MQNLLLSGCIQHRRAETSVSVTTVLLREQSSGQHIPILAMTAHALKGDQERCLAAGMDGYISKPIRTADLFAAIETALGKGKPTPPEELSMTVPLQS